MFVNFQYRGLQHLELYDTLSIEAWLKLNVHFDCRYLELRNACTFRLVYIVLNVRDGIESKYTSIVFLIIFEILDIPQFGFDGRLLVLIVPVPGSS